MLGPLGISFGPFGSFASFGKPTNKIDTLSRNCQIFVRKTVLASWHWKRMNNTTHAALVKHWSFSEET